jgi:hypothetical protein
VFRHQHNMRLTSSRSANCQSNYMVNKLLCDSFVRQAGAEWLAEA